MVVALGFRDLPRRPHGTTVPMHPAVVWPRLWTPHAAGPAGAGRMQPGAWRRRAHAGRLRPVRARWSGSCVVGRDNTPERFPEIREIAQAVEHVALVPDTPGLVELAHRIVPALTCPGRIVATDEAKHIAVKPCTGEVCLEVAHDGSVLRQLGLHEVVRLRRAPRLMICPVEIGLEALMCGVFLHHCP
jgi:hypothetical protein